MDYVAFLSFFFSEIAHSAASSNELLDHYTTHTQTSEVRWGTSFSGHQHVYRSYSQEDITQATEENLKWKKFST